jgi:diacylglycerol kinase (ATP)
MAQLPRSLIQSANVVSLGNTRQVDAGRVILDGQTYFFDNNCALAMEPMVTIENINMTRLSGTVRYLVATIKALLKLKAWHMRVTWDDGQYEGPVYLLSICNSPRTGGVFYMAPAAKMDDGLLDFVLAPQVSKATVLTLVPRILKGTHINHPQVIYGRSSQLAVESEPATPVHADGEVLTRGASRIRYDLLPGKITLLSP